MVHNGPICRSQVLNKLNIKLISFISGYNKKNIQVFLDLYFRLRICNQKFCISLNKERHHEVDCRNNYTLDDCSEIQILQFLHIPMLLTLSCNPN